jgi:hypothetical protein
MRAGPGLYLWIVQQAQVGLVLGRFRVNKTVMNELPKERPEFFRLNF